MLGIREWTSVPTLVSSTTPQLHATFLIWFLSRLMVSLKDCLEITRRPVGVRVEKMGLLSKRSGDTFMDTRVENIFKFASIL